MTSREAILDTHSRALPRILLFPSPLLSLRCMWTTFKKDYATSEASSREGSGFRFFPFTARVS